MAEEKFTPLLYNKNIARDLEDLTDLIIEVYCEIEKPSWSNQTPEEIGFYKRDKVSKSSIFFGIWYESWKFFGIPLCIAIDYQGNTPFDKIQKVKSFIIDKKIIGVRFSDFQDYALVLFDHNYFNFKDDGDRLAKLFRELVQLIGIQNKPS